MLGPQRRPSDQGHAGNDNHSAGHEPADPIKSAQPQPSNERGPPPPVQKDGKQSYGYQEIDARKSESEESFLHIYRRPPEETDRDEKCGRLPANTRL